MIKGSLVALITPMDEAGEVDYQAYRSLIDWHIQEGTNALVVVGTSGESPTVSVEEQCVLIKEAVTYAKGRIPIIAGAGGNSTQEAIALTDYAHSVGVQITLQVVPYYNKPTQEGMYQHFKAIAEAVASDIILYNVPGRTIADLSNETVARLAQIPNIVGIKDATGDIGRGVQLLQMVPDDFAVYSGDDLTAAAYILMGAHGNISVTANVVPRLMSALCKAALESNVSEVRRITAMVDELSRSLFCESNPIPVKWATAQLGKTKTGIRLPLTGLQPQFHERVRAAMKKAEAI